MCFHFLYIVLPYLSQPFSLVHHEVVILYIYIYKYYFRKMNGKGNPKEWLALNLNPKLKLNLKMWMATLIYLGWFTYTLRLISVGNFIGEVWTQNCRWKLRPFYLGQQVLVISIFNFFIINLFAFDNHSNINSKNLTTLPYKNRESNNLTL